MCRFEGIRLRMRGEIVALALLSVATAPRVGGAQAAPAPVRVTRVHELVGTVGAVMSATPVRVQPATGLDARDTGREPQEWTVESEARTNARAQPLLRASTLRGDWRWQREDGVWMPWDGREIPVGATLAPGVHTLRLRLRGPVDVAPPVLTVRLLPAPATSRGDAAEPPRAFGPPRR